MYAIGDKENGVLEINQSRLHAAYPKWGPDYQVSFDITVNKLPSAAGGWTNVIHATINGNHGTYGERNPSVWIHNSGYMLITAAVNGDVNFGYNYHFELKKPFHLTIRQATTGKKTLYQIIVDGKQLFGVLNTKPGQFANMKVFTSDPWYPSFTSDLGTVKNLQILTGADCLKGLPAPKIKPDVSCKFR